ncbi:MAG TPA: aminotransferase class I/II-fold pyridoxal phosphate-dependent enzyme [Clostridiales bacterium]|nr:aminotransferase class I/II-fold pyridoxal phosphate-dependent enzyme [Clostridiales bacterium]HPV02091.1 aminotransferase class I/II-fold pyridoxal phosphate-dependent enzyme [Clostridiales bacterium]
MDITKLSREELEKRLSELKKEYEGFRAKGLKLDMSRGKPCKEQLDLSVEMLAYPYRDKNFKTDSCADVRNYGLVDGLPEAKELFARMLEVSAGEIIVGNNSSLSMMYDSISRAMTFGVYGSPEPWGRLPKVKFLCPSPGYDRHFAICELFGIEMITIDMKDDGPDMDTVERLVAEDDSIKGIWCTPKYSNPTGITYSDGVVDRLASMRTAAEDFRIFWDNAYVVHHLTEKPDRLKNILEACKKAGNPDRVFIFASTSKITFPGSGVAVMAASENNINLIRKQLGIRTIGPDKINQLRHVLFFRDLAGIEEHMKKHAAILKPKFDMVDSILESRLGGKNIASWSKPNGGYFISFDTMPGCASAVVKMAGEAGVVFTPAGATYPYGKDPQDRNIRIAPTLPPVEELRTAMELLCICVELVSIQKLLAA